MKTTAGALAAGLLGAVLLGPAFAQAPNAPQRPQASPAPGNDEEDVPDEEAGPMGVKVCTVISPSWRSVVPVPETWQVKDCADFARSVQAPDYRLGCMFYAESPKFSWGAGKDAKPNPDCGWAEEAGGRTGK